MEPAVYPVAACFRTAIPNTASYGMDSRGCRFLLHDGEADLLPRTQPAAETLARTSPGGRAPAGGPREAIEDPPGFISAYETGSRRLDILELRQICKACGITLKKFIDRFEG